ncbi:T-cell surface glycoprotein CD3 epsilon chain [Narcine bancroftii]|uniref:T-cell surface glycoprotein CD3 epsilon chain n=1 Tax=Narcine bancroftii TaxID=1343680 RepID=UPI0038310715
MPPAKWPARVTAESAPPPRASASLSMYSCSLESASPQHSQTSKFPTGLDIGLIECVPGIVRGPSETWPPTSLSTVFANLHPAKRWATVSNPPQPSQEQNSSICCLPCVCKFTEECGNCTDNNHTSSNCRGEEQVRPIPMELGVMVWIHSGIAAAAILMLLGVAASAEHNVRVEKTTVILVCPFDSSKSYEWYKSPDTVLKSDHENEYSIFDFTNSNNGEYHCKNEQSKYSFYIQAKVCSDCIDLSTGMVIAIICGDLFFTLLVSGLVYYFAKQRGASSKDFRQLDNDFPPHRPPHMTPAHQTEYAPIKSGQRDVYDKLQRH